MPSCYVETLLGTAWSNYTLTSLWSDNMVAGFRLFAVKCMADVPWLSILQRLRLKICTKTVSIQPAVPSDSYAYDSSS